ncbi:MAG: ABC transporter substrate-binding protein [Firmicutes bacterium]|jgi:NitT/TauT family transport system substrate-binding protein|nr:ABC transporter substrate-binding protein [Bacillota bacterium]
MIRRLLVLAAVLPLLAYSVALARPGDVKLNVMVLSGTTGLSLVKILEDNPNIGPGIAATYTVAKSPDVVVSRLVSGEADVAALPTNTAALLYNRGVPVQIAAITNWGVTYVVGSDSSIADWKGLRGKEIAVAGRGATPDILLRYVLKANGLNPDADVRIQYYSSPVELAQLVIAGRVRVAALPEPWVTEVMRNNASARILLDYQEEWRRIESRKESYPQSCLVVRTQFARDNPGIVREFLKLAESSSSWVVSHPEQAGALAEAHVQISREAARDSIPRCNLRFAGMATAGREVEHFLSRLLAFDPQSIGGKLPDAGFYWNE